MNTDPIKGNWKIVKGKLHHAWGKLTNDDIEKMEGNTLELEGRLQKAYGYDKERAHQEVQNFIEKEHLH